MRLKMAYPVYFNYPRIGVDFVVRFLIHDNPILVASKIAKADSVGIRLGTTTSVKFKSSSADRVLSYIGNYRVLKDKAGVNMFRQGFRATRESREGEERRGIFRMMVGPELAEWLHRAAEVFAVNSGRRELDWLMIWAQQFLQYLVRGQVMNPVEADVKAFLVACEQKGPLRFRDQAQRAASMFLREVVGRRLEEFAETILRQGRKFSHQADSRDGAAGKAEAAVSGLECAPGNGSEKAARPGVARCGG